MALYAIGDLHLSQGVKKPMDIFFGWEGYTERLVANWRRLVTASDTVVLAGDTSWGMTLEEALPDFILLNSLPGEKKLILKGNHDYWWTSAAKMRAFFEANGLNSLFILHNNAFAAGGFAVCGSRGWVFENGEPHDDKIINREAIRIEASLKAAQSMPGERLLFLHYPPVFAEQELTSYLELMQQYGISRCFYGHIHGAGAQKAVTGLYNGVTLRLIAADYLNFCPLFIGGAQV
jgi:predicted phosphohydrolase